MAKWEMDNDIHMVKQEVREPNVNHLHFIRELVETGKLQGDTAAAVIDLKEKVAERDAQALGDVRSRLSREEHIAEHGAE